MCRTWSGRIPRGSLLHGEAPGPVGPAHSRPAGTAHLGAALSTEWYENEEWADIPLGRDGRSGTARALFPRDTEWIRRWSCYAEVMDTVLRHTDDSLESLFPKLGDPHLRVYQELADPVHFHTASLEDTGRRLHQLVVAAVRRLAEDEEALLSEFADLPAPQSQQAREAVQAWNCALASPGQFTRAARRWASLFRSEATTKSYERTMRDRLWRHGLAKPDDYPPTCARGLQALTRVLDDAMRPYLRVGAAEDADLVDQLLPTSIARRIRRDAEGLKRKRQEYPPEVVDSLGIDEDGYTDLLAAALPRLRGCIAKGESMLVLGPTSSGKSRIGRIAVCHAITRAQRRHGRAIVLLPTKALVNQAVAEWRDFLEDTPYRDWRILPGSRDHAQNDEAIARREFDIAVIIPEKLAGLLAGGMTLDGCDIVIVDELQNLADPQRGPRLEMLMTSIRAQYKIPMIGLSATLTEQAAEDVRRWLQIEPSAVISSSRRPVPLDLAVCDEQQARVRTAELQELRREQHLSTLLRQWERDPDLKRQLQAVGAYRRALALAVSLLKGSAAVHGGDVHSVLCFVGSREDAQKLTRMAQTLLDRDPGMRQVDPDSNPFLGRFSSLDEETAQQRNRTLLRFPHKALRDSVARSLRTGVGYHSARLEQDMRVEVETAFRDGVIRLLFATDTLKLGINLPADAVVVASVTTPTGNGKSQVLNRDTVAQRLGRAGRLGIGVSPRGYGYLVVPEKRPTKHRVEFEETELVGLAELVPPTVDSEPDIDRALRALIDVDAVFRHYIGYTSPGAAISSRVDETWFSTQLLHWAVREGVPLRRSALQEQTLAFYGASLGAVTDVPPPDPAAVVGRLESYDLIAAVDGGEGAEGEHLMVTGLGRAVAASGLPFEDSATVEQLMRAGAEGAGDLTLLWLATGSRHVRETMNWISIVPQLDDDPAEQAQRHNAVDLARVFAAPPADRAGHARLLRSANFVDALPDRDLLGRGAVADDLRRLVDGPAPDPGPEKINALLRACVLLLWKEGCPLALIETAVQENLKIKSRRGERTVNIHSADVRTLGGNTSYLFDAVRELTGVRPQGTDFRRFEALAESVEFGVPPVLAPLARLFLRATHRERIVGLIPVLRANPEYRFDSHAELVDRYMRRPATPPRDRALARELAQFALTDSERAQVRGELDKIDQRRRRGLRLPLELRQSLLPGTDTYTLEDALDQLARRDGEHTPRQAARILTSFGLDVEDGEDGTIVLRSRITPDLSARMAVHTDEFRVGDLERARGRADIVLACAGTTDGVRIAEIRSDRPNPVVVQPTILLEAAARIARLTGPEEQDRGTDLLALLSGLHAAGGPEDDPAAEADGWDEDGWDDQAAWEELDDGRADLRGHEAARGGHRLLELLTAAPPVLGRTELNRLVAGMTVAPPPAIPAAHRADRTVEETV